MHAVLFLFGDMHQSLLHVHAFLTFEINFQTICGFTTGRLITVITQQYIPFYLLDSLNLPKVINPHILALLISHFHQTSIAIGPLVLYVFASVASFFVQKISKRLGDEVSQMNMYMQVAVLHHSELQLVALRYNCCGKTTIVCDAVA